MRKRLLGRFIVLCTLISISGCWSNPEPPAPLPLPVEDPQIITRPLPPLAVNDFAAVRHFRFQYDVTITELPPGEMARIWIPLAGDTSLQRVKREVMEVPGTPRVQTEPTFENAMIYTEAKADDNGQIPIKVTYLVERVEAVPGGGEAVKLSANADKISGAEIRVAYDKVLKQAESMQGVKGSEFAAIGEFLAETKLSAEMAQAKFGFVLNNQAKEQRVDASAWANIAYEGHWRAIDLLRAIENSRIEDHAFGTLSPNRIQISTGENIALIPAAQASSVPQLLLPYVEVAGKPHSAQVAKFRYDDVEEL